MKKKKISTYPYPLLLLGIDYINKRIIRRNKKHLNTKHCSLLPTIS
ncbi:hypothetical protein K8R14_00300 [bacterium]|nr:hypothetical protein [bacterium]